MHGPAETWCSPSDRMYGSHHPLSGCLTSQTNTELATNQNRSEVFREHYRSRIPDLHFNMKMYSAESTDTAGTVARVFLSPSVIQIKRGSRARTLSGCACSLDGSTLLIA